MYPVFLLWYYGASSVVESKIVSVRKILFLQVIFVLVKPIKKKLEEQGKENILKTKGYDYSFAGLDSLLLRADIIIGNLETPITNLPVSPLAESEKYRIHKGDTVLTPSTLKKHNISVVTLANNHTMDYGTKGLEQTMEILKKYSINFFGAGKNDSEATVPYKLNYTIGSRKFHMIIVGGLPYSNKYKDAYGFYATESKTGVKGWTIETIVEQIRKVRLSDTTAFIIAFPHWFENYRWKSQAQTELAHAMIDAGANIVIGHGTHMFQEIEGYKNKWIIYSMGNLLFNAPGRYEQKSNAHPYSLAAMLNVSETDIVLHLYPILSDNLVTNYQPRLVNKKEFDETNRLLLRHSPDSAMLTKKLTLKEDKIGYYMEILVNKTE